MVGAGVVNVIDLVSAKDSKITNVSLYSGRAEITRLYKFAVKAGQNQVRLSGLPSILDQNSLRVESRGTATINDVTLSAAPTADKTVTNELAALLEEQEALQSAADRNKKAITALDAYLDTLNLGSADPSQLPSILESFDKAGDVLHKKSVKLEKELTDIVKKAQKEREKANGAREDAKLKLKASIGVVAEADGEVEIALVYAVGLANWEATYDIRVDTESFETPITLIYNTVISQDTGESWDDVPITLETATPSFGVNVPALIPWKLAAYKPVPPPSLSRSNSALAEKELPAIALPRQRMQSFNTLQTPGSIPQRSFYGGSANTESGETDEDDSFVKMKQTNTASALLPTQPKGNVTATFRVPGVVTVPSDGDAHTFTLLELKLGATMSWVAVPKMDQRVHSQAMVKNDSEHTLLAGPASIYVDGSFIAKTTIPLVNPQQSFYCPLGLDPSIRITYHPLQTKSSTTGFMTKFSNTVFTQHVTIHNTKSTVIESLKVSDQIPVSEDSQITVKLLNPPLEANVSAPLPPTGSADTNGSGPWSNKGRSRASTILSPNGTLFPSEVHLSEGVLARWSGSEEANVDYEMLGKDGRLYWLCEVPADGKIELTLSWEVAIPNKMHVVGL